MKKILVLLILLFSFNVHAATYYSEYIEFKDWTDEDLEVTDTLLKEEDTWYKYYNETIKGDFYIEGENPSNYPYMDLNTSYYTSYTSYSNMIPDIKKNRIIDIKKVYEYVKANKFRYIKLDNIRGGYGNLRIPEIDIKNNDKKIDFRWTCTGCNANFDKYINNGIIVENMSYIENGGSLIIDLLKDYEYDDIDVYLSLFDVSNEPKTFDISFYGTNEILKSSFSQGFQLVYLDDAKTFEFNYKNMSEVNLWQNNILESEDIKPHSKVVGEKNYYRYKDLYYFYYNKILTYSDYMKEASIEFPIKSDYFKKVYKYFKRDKVVIPDEIIIKDYSSNVKDYIESEVPINIEGDIDIYKNGLYEVNIVLPFMNINTMVEVDIEENDIRSELENLKLDYQKLKEEYDNLENSNINLDLYIKELEEKYSNLSLEKDSVSNEYTKTYNEMISLLNDYRMKVNELNIEIEDYENRISLVEDSKYKEIKMLENEIFNLKSEEKVIPKNNNTYFIFEGIFLVLTIVIYIIKKAKKH